MRTYFNAVSLLHNKHTVAPCRISPSVHFAFLLETSDALGSHLTRVNMSLSRSRSKRSNDCAWLRLQSSTRQEKRWIIALRKDCTLSGHEVGIVDKSLVLEKPKQCCGPMNRSTMTRGNKLAHVRVHEIEAVSRSLILKRVLVFDNSWPQSRFLFQTSGEDTPSRNKQT
jgi:hypothetical protein